MRIPDQGRIFVFKFARSALPVHTDGMVEIARRIREIRKNLGLNQAEFAEELGVAQGSISKWESGRETPRIENLRRIAEKYDIPVGDLMGITEEHEFRSDDDYGGLAATVVGPVQAGLWREALEWEDGERFRVHLPQKQALEGLNLVGFLVRGPSMDLVFPDGSIIVAVWSLDKFAPQDGDYVVIERVRADGMVEATLKELRFDAEGRPWAWPRSRSPLFQQPIDLAGDDTVSEVRVIGIVVASIRFEPVDAERFSEL